MDSSFSVSDLPDIPDFQISWFPWLPDQIEWDWVKDWGQGYIDPQGNVLSLKYTVSTKFLPNFVLTWKSVTSELSAHNQFEVWITAFQGTLLLTSKIAPLVGHYK